MYIRSVRMYSVARYIRMKVFAGMADILSSAFLLASTDLYNISDTNYCVCNP